MVIVERGMLAVPQQNLDNAITETVERSITTSKHRCAGNNRVLDTLIFK